MKKKAILQSLPLLSGFILALALSSAPSMVKAEGEASFTEGNWSTVHGGTDSFEIGESTIVGKSTSWMSNFLVKEFPAALGDYEVSVTFQGTMTYPNDHQVQFGIVPWYLDEDNYLVAYGEWSHTQNVSGMYNFNLTGRINGGLPYRKDGSGFMAKEWDDIWMDNANAQNGAPACNESVLKIIKTRDADGINDNFKFIFNGHELDNGVKTVRDMKQHESRIPKCGIYAYADDFTIKDFTVTHLEKQELYSALEDGAAGKNGWTKTADGYSVDSKGKTSANDTMLIDPNAANDGTYAVSFEPEIASHDQNYEVGGLVYYKDQYNYIGGAVKVENGTTYAGFTGRKCTQQDKVLTIEDINEFQEVNLDLASVNNITVEKRGVKMRLLADGNELAVYEDSAIISSTRTGVFAFGADVEFKGYQKVEGLAYVPYDWYSTTISDKTYYISAKTDEANAVTYNRGSIVFNANSVDSTDKTKLSSIYYSSGYYAYINYGVNVTSAVTANTVIGIYPWLENAQRFCRVVFDNSGIKVLSTFTGQNVEATFNYPGSFSFVKTDTETKLFKVSIAFDGKLSVSVGNKYDDGYEEWISTSVNFTAEGRDNHCTPNVGMLAGGTAVTAKMAEMSGYPAYQALQQNGWECYGSMPDTWTFEGDDVIHASQVNGTSYMDAKLLKPNNVKDFYMGATITATNCSNAEQKAAFYPWYIDNSNYLIVMMSKWTANASASIVFTGRINGRVLGGREWHDYTTAYTFEGVANKFEIQIDGDNVYAYLNGGLNPVQSVKFAGLSERNVSSSKTGFFFYNCDLLIQDYDICASERVYRITEKPVISYVGTLKTTGTVGTAVRLPVFTASNSVGDVMDVTVSVTDPNGDPVTIASSRFTPEIEGVYHVKAECTDSWGNVADPLEYDVTVTGGGSSSSSQQGGDTPTTGGCGGSITGVAALFGIASIALLGAASYLGRKRK